MKEGEKAILHTGIAFLFPDRWKACLETGVLVRYIRVSQQKKAGQRERRGLSGRFTFVKTSM
jgi:hypothetical protein